MLKNLTIFLLCMLLLSSCSNTENNPKSSYTNSLLQSEVNSSSQSTSQTKLNSEYQSLTDFQAKIYENQNLCAVAYLGYLEGNYSDITAYLKEKGIFKEFPFLSDIKEENTVTASGGELYAIIPVDENIIITVNESILDENDYTFKPGKKLLEISNNQIILLRGNFSDILPNFLITVSKNGEKLLEYNPCLSLKDGSLNLAEGIYDFTPYEILKSNNK